MFCAPDLAVSGFALWGDGTRADCEAFFRTIPPPGTSPLVAPMPRYGDMRGIGHPQPGVFAAIAEYMVSNAERMRAAITCGAVVHAGGFGGALATGFQHAVGLSFPHAEFTDPVEAFAWLGCPAHADLARQIVNIQAEVSGVPQLLRDLGAVLERPEVTLAQAARQLGTSARSLQRQLSELGTTFRHEWARARVRLALPRLLDSSQSVTAIAVDVGCSSPQHFAQIFRKVTGKTPMQWRAEHRPG